MHDPNVAAELAAFNSKFGLPACTVKPIAVTQALPLAAACELSVVYNTAAGAMTAAAPPYDAYWATEIALDVQCAHATAPLARIVLIEAADASLNSLIGAIKLANAMGPGAVSMSFGAGEGSWTGSVDGAFGGANMSYLAATGDNGAGTAGGMSISAAGLLSWSSPVLGSYKVRVTARDSKTGLSGQGVPTIQIASAGPVFTVTPQSGVAGKPFSGSIGLTAPGATSLSVSIAGAPLGMGFGYIGSAITMAWANPVTGIYTLSLVAVDSARLSAKTSVPIVINAN